VLLANVVLLAALRQIMHQVLSLSGIAGSPHHRRLAVDAKVMIYARIREGDPQGRVAEAAIPCGFEKAFLRDRGF